MYIIVNFGGLKTIINVYGADVPKWIVHIFHEWSKKKICAQISKIEGIANWVLTSVYSKDI